MSEWKEKRLEEVCIVDKECLPGNTDPSYRFFYISLSDVEKGRILNSVQNISFKDSPSRARRILHDYDVLMATVRPNLQAFAILGNAINNFIASTGFAILSEKDNNSTEYIYHYLFSDDATRQINNLVAGSNYPAISSTAVKLLKINIPTSLPEQRKIARILSTVDAVIEKTEAAIAKYKAIKSGMMRDLFTRGIDLKTGKLRPRYEDAPELYKGSALGWVPREWEVVRIGELLKSCILAEIQDGNHGEIHPKARDFVEDGVPFIMASDITKNKIDFDRCKRIRFELYEKLRIGFSQSKDVLLSHKASIGFTAIVPDNCRHLMLTPQVTYYRVGDDSKLAYHYLNAYFQSGTFQSMLENYAKQSTRDYIGITAQQKLTIAIPDINEQKLIAARLSKLNLTVDKEELLLHKHQQLKAALMSDLLTSKVRVKYEDEKAEAM